MAAPRLRGLSTRISEHAHTRLCDRAKAEGVTVSTLVAQILGEAEPNPTPQGSGDPRLQEMADQLGTLRDRVEYLDPWVDLLVALVLTHVEEIPCPGCAAGPLTYFEEEAPEGGLARNGIRCTSCGWQMTL